MYELLNIPKHVKCTNCGGCCGPVFANATELDKIRAYVKEHGILPRDNDPITCLFRDEEEKRCIIYPVRPMICRLMGVSKGMQCPNGNTVEIEGDTFMDLDKQHVLLTAAAVYGGKGDKNIGK